MRTALAVIAMAGLMAACTSTVDPSDSAAGSPTEGATTEPSATATATTEPSTTAGADLQAFEGAWEFTVDDVRLNYGSGDYAGATVAVSGARVTAEGGGGARTEFPIDGSLSSPVGEHDIKCSSTTCTSAVLTMISSYEDGFAVVSPMTGEPIEAGAEACGAPVVEDAGIIDDFDGTSFSFLAGAAGGDVTAGGDCWQVVWTITATKVP